MIKYRVEDPRPLCQRQGLRCNPAYCLPTCMKVGGIGSPGCEQGSEQGKISTIFLELLRSLLGHLTFTDAPSSAAGWCTSEFAKC